jgi:hypothetical protein
MQNTTIADSFTACLPFRFALLKLTTERDQSPRASGGHVHEDAFSKTRACVVRLFEEWLSSRQESAEVFRKVASVDAAK